MVDFPRPGAVGRVAHLLNISQKSTKTTSPYFRTAKAPVPMRRRITMRILVTGIMRPMRPGRNHLVVLAHAQQHEAEGGVAR